MAAVVYIVLVNCHVLLELTQKLALEPELPVPFQTQGCLSQSVLQGTLFNGGLLLLTIF